MCFHTFSSFRCQKSKYKSIFQNDWRDTGFLYAFHPNLCCAYRNSWQGFPFSWILIFIKKTIIMGGFESGAITSIKNNRSLQKSTYKSFKSHVKPASMPKSIARIPIALNEAKIKKQKRQHLIRQLITLFLILGGAGLLLYSWL